MSLNGIAHLPLKADRQLAKLNLAAAKRAADGNPRDQLVIDQLPTVYSTTTNDTALVVDNPNPGGLVVGRPWI